MNYGYPTTMRHPRTMRQSGTAYANAVEHHKSNDHSGIAIVLICGVILVMAIVHTMGWL
jgi:hypothetical protein